jgi:hypothetical protein
LAGLPVFVTAAPGVFEGVLTTACSGVKTLADFEPAATNPWVTALLLFVALVWTGPMTGTADFEPKLTTVLALSVTKLVEIVCTVAGSAKTLNFELGATIFPWPSAF